MRQQVKSVCGCGVRVGELACVCGPQQQRCHNPAHPLVRVLARGMGLLREGAMGQLVLNGRALVWCDAAAGATTRGARRRKTSTCLRRSSLASTSSSSSCWCHAYAFLALAPCLLRPCEPWRAGLVVGCFRQARRSDALALLRDKVQADSDFNLAKHVCHVHQFNRYVLRGVFTEPWPGACEVASVAPGRRHAKMPGCIFGGLASLACIFGMHLGMPRC